MLAFYPVELETIDYLREGYLTDIRLSQELMLEWLVAKGQSYSIVFDGNEAGYFILSEDNYLIEFYILSDYLVRKEYIFKKVLEGYSVSDIYCKSFDSLLLTCSLTYSKSSEIIGTIFRDYDTSVSVEQEKDITVRLAEESDISTLLLYDDSELFESPDELNFTVSNRMVYLFQKGGELLGCGYFIRILPDKDFYDLGMWTNPKFRNRGYATMIISYLKKFCLDNDLIPVCGCAADNLASRKTLEKCGFVSKHCIIQFKL